MIVSDEHRYVFVELPKTGSTAISNELCEYYAGRRVGPRHMPYHRFLRFASADQRSYFTFACIRNPLDEAVSIYFRERSNRAGHYTDPNRLRAKGGNIATSDLARYRYIKDSGADFAAYFRRFYQLSKFYRYPYDNWSMLAHHEFDLVIRFEELQSGFSAALRRIGVSQVRALPISNQSRGKDRPFESYYEPSIRTQAARIFGPFMRKWGYEFPADWGKVSVSRWCVWHFYALRPVRRLYWRYLDDSSWLRRQIEHVLP